MSETELKPCPFCGKPPIACPDDSYGAAMVACPDVNECPVQPIADASLRKGETLATAIDRWNTRSQSERVSRLEGARDRREMLAVAAMRYIEQLRAEEGDSVTILCDDPEADTRDAQVAIDCFGEWTGWKDRRFYGESVLQCLAKALSARSALNQSDGGGNG